ncbi:MAG: phosphorylase [Thermonema sp.]|uniref:nucleoside phosphorylase n=1 Tax=Thermonema sp. TaxID=2231181 RepID=UPI0021DBF767|nr:nucleoside phosphorylase [Thermonema sp.]GIV38606.1 MAG: phosphorylase [Thermonema sp.]
MNISTYPASELIVNPDGSIYHLGLRPEQLADTVIVVGDPERVPMISRHFEKIEYRLHKREFVTHTGSYRGVRMTVISSGMGTDNVEILMTELDALANIDLEKRLPKSNPRRLRIVRVGTSGSIQAGVPVGSLLASAVGVGIDTLMCFYDYDTPKEQQLKAAMQQLQQHLALPFEPYAAPASPALLELFSGLTQGVTLTCPGFYAPQGRELRAPARLKDWVQRLQSFEYEGLRLTNLEMETAGYYAMAQLLGHDMISLNAILADRTNGIFAEKPKEVVEELIVYTLDKLAS